ncbi:unnamed protein product [Cyprideis torosa]|uniref:Uncharacterized protein n=1 Tax=Cyprideis torosa TaxID=163714 RepID=A0A7R8W0J6_9CRUS|nr:unnamed protein product [Cyprideis torosa]CAG0879637.1 unnamed protein product [Cyprideis torosa]
MNLLIFRIPWRRHALKPANEPVQLRIFLLPYLKDTVKKKRMMEGALATILSVWYNWGHSYPVPDLWCGKCFQCSFVFPNPDPANNYFGSGPCPNFWPALLMAYGSVRIVASLLCSLPFFRRPLLLLLLLPILSPFAFNVLLDYLWFPAHVSLYQLFESGVLDWLEKHGLPNSDGGAEINEYFRYVGNTNEQFLGVRPQSAGTDQIPSPIDLEPTESVEARDSGALELKRCSDSDINQREQRTKEEDVVQQKVRRQNRIEMGIKAISPSDEGPWQRIKGPDGKPHWTPGSPKTSARSALRK